MIRKRLGFCRSVRYRYIKIVILIAIVLLIYAKLSGYLFQYMKYTECEKLIINEFSEKSKKYIYFEKEKRPEALNATALRGWILNQNAREKILNIDLYGAIIIDTLIFVIQVHQYSCNINYLLASLSEVDGIQDTLIIFSHSYVDHSLNHLIQSAEFCRILQLFYPYSIQAYPNEFPGYGENDCPTNLNVRAAEKNNCTGAMTPDMHGRYRDPIYAEKKHHWWWTANKVFGDLSYTIDHKGVVVFLEDNFYIHKNFIFIAYEMKKIAETLPRCHFLSFGSSLYVKGENAYSLEFTIWEPKYHSNLLAIDVSAWNSIKSHYDIFCHTDDYSWSRSLFEISMNRRDGKMFKVLSSVAARALETTCSDNDVLNCHVVENIVEIFNLQKINKDLLFPPYFEILHDIVLYDDEFISAEYGENNGGWNDERDKQLCRNMTMNNVNKYFVYRHKKIVSMPIFSRRKSISMY